MSDGHRLTVVLLGLLLAATVLHLIRQRRLREELAWVWLAWGVGAPLLAMWPTPLMAVVRWTGLASGGVMLTLLAVGALSGVGLLLSVRVSAQAQQIQALCQEVALLRQRQEAQEDTRGGASGAQRTG